MRDPINAKLHQARHGHARKLNSVVNMFANMPNANRTARTKEPESGTEISKASPHFCDAPRPAAGVFDLA